MLQVPRQRQRHLEAGKCDKPSRVPLRLAQINPNRGLPVVIQDGWGGKRLQQGEAVKEHTKKIHSLAGLLRPRCRGRAALPRAPPGRPGRQAGNHQERLSKECMSCTPPSACAAPVRHSSRCSPLSSRRHASLMLVAPRSCSQGAVPGLDTGSPNGRRNSAESVIQGIQPEIGST